MKCRIFVGFLILFFLIGCGQIIKNIPAITGTGSTAYMEYDQVVRIIEANLDVYSEQEITELRLANKILNAAKAELERVAAGKTLSELAVDLPKLMPLFDSMKQGYKTARSVVMAKIDTYSLADQAILLRYDRTCFRFDEAVMNSMFGSGSNEQIVRDILNFAALVAKIVLPLLIL